MLEDRDMLDLLKTRRSIRSYKDKEIEAEQLEQILKAGLLAPSSRGRRPWEFITVIDKQKLKLLSGCREGSSYFLADAAAAVVIAADPAKCDVWVEDCSIAAIIMQLTAHSMGLGSCWMQVRERFTVNQEKVEDFVKRTLDIPENYHVECILAFGYPDEEKRAYEDKDLPYDKLHWEKF